MSKIILTMVGIVGCGVHEKPVPSKLGQTKFIVEGDPAEQHSRKPSIRIVSALEGRDYRPGEMIDIACELAIPEGANMPTLVDVQVTDSMDRECANAKVHSQDERGGGIHTLNAQLKAPMSGQYFVKARVIETITRTETDTITGSSSTRITASPTIGIRVK